MGKHGQGSVPSDPATGLSQNFLAEPSLTTFNNAGGSYEVSPQLWTQYRRAADALAKSFARDAAKLANDPFADGIELVLTTILQSPNFLYRTEFGTGTVVGGKIPLNDYELASRLSYALGNTMPDDTLFMLAQSGQLHTNAAVLNEAKRLLDAPAGQATISDFYNQLMREVDPSDLMRDPTLVPAFIPGMGLEMKRERELFVQEVILRQGGGLRELFTAPYTFVNSHLAGLYGVTAPAGDDWVKAALNPTERGGLYTQLGFLARTAYDKATRPIIRGVHVNRHVLCATIPDPPPNVNTTLPTTSGPVTNRQLFEQLTSPAECQACHGALINPLGFAFENFDTMGRFRTKEGDLPINAVASARRMEVPRMTSAIPQPPRACTPRS